MLPGVFTAFKKDNTKYYRACVTYRGKHISLGSFDNETNASDAYIISKKILDDSNINIDDYEQCSLSFEKWVSLINFRDNGIYSRAPIYMKDTYFIYYLTQNTHLIFDTDDLFYYSSHKISQRGGHLYVTEYGMQVNILSRYGIKNYGVEGRDYEFINGIRGDFRYCNIRIINKYHGVLCEKKKNKTMYVAKIHIHGDYIIGRYHTDYEAAIAYNKAVDILKENGVKKSFPTNYIVELDAIKYSSIYNKTRINNSIREYRPQ